MKPETLDFAIMQLEVEVANLSRLFRETRNESYEQIKANYHEKIVNPLKSVLAMAENVESSLKSDSAVGTRH